MKKFADALREDIWGKGKKGDPDTLKGACIAVQFYYFLGPDALWEQAESIRLLNQVALDLFPGRGARVTIINDHPKTTFEDIRQIAKEYDRRVELREAGIV